MSRHTAVKSSRKFYACLLSYRLLAALCWTLSALLPATVLLRGADDSGKVGDAMKPAPEISSIETRIQRIRNVKELDAELRDELIAANTKAIERHRAADEFAAKTAEWIRMAETAPAELEKVKAELAKAGEQGSGAAAVTIDPKTSLTQMEQSLARAEAERDNCQRKLDDLNSESDRRAERRREIAERDEEIAEELRGVQESLERKSNEKDELTAETHEDLLKSRCRALEHEEELHRQELLAYDATADLVSAQRDLAATRLQSAEELLDAWQKLVNDFRKSEANRHHAEARQAAENVHPVLRPIAEINVELAAARRDLAARIEETISESETVTERLEELQEQFEKVTERAKKIGFTEAIGLLLRKHRDALSVIDESLQNKRARADSVSQLNVLLTDYEEQRLELSELKSRVRTEMAALRRRIAPGEAARVERELREILEMRRRSLDNLIRETTRYVDELMELETIERQLVSCVRDFEAFSDAHILWIRTTGLPQWADLARLRSSTGWLLNPDHWQRSFRVAADDAARHPELYGAAVFVLVGLAAARRRFISKRKSNAGAGASCGAADIRSTAALVLFDVLAAAWGPALVAFIGHRFGGPSQSGEFPGAVGRALVTLAIPWFVFGFLRRRFTGACHFGATISQAEAGPRWLRIASGAALPLLFVIALTEAQSAESHRNTLGRVAFVALMGVCAAAGYSAFHKARIDDSAAGDATTANGARRRNILRFAALSLPLLFAAGSIAGYHFTAMQLAARAAVSAAFILCLMEFSAFCIVQAGRLQSEDFSKISDGATRSGDGNDPPPVHPTTRSEGTPGMTEMLFTQVQHLVRLGTLVLLCGGLLQIWSDVIPTLTVLRSIELWPDPFRWIDAATAAEEETKIVTAAGLLLALAIAAVTVAAARNVRGALEMTLFHYVRLDTGARYAVTAICRYAVGVCGLFASCSQLGIGWEQLNWLVAAMTVGLGFGLQEIFANFVSGLILLFERPVRIGDIISVEGVTGTVSRIRIRATTITDGDMRELIVPNKELITGRVINWTLSNTVARMTVTVKTAHGVDPDKARNVLLSVAAQHPLVLKQPAPQALFDEFSDKTQNFTLRVFMANCDVYPQLRHELLTSIQRTFRQVGIPISFSDAAPLPVPVPLQEQVAA